MRWWSNTLWICGLRAVIDYFNHSNGVCIMLTFMEHYEEWKEMFFRTTFIGIVSLCILGV